LKRRAHMVVMRKGALPLVVAHLLLAAIARQLGDIPDATPGAPSSNPRRVNWLRARDRG